MIPIGLTFCQEFVGLDLEDYMLMIGKSFTEFRMSLKIFSGQAEVGNAQDPRHHNHQRSRCVLKVLH